MLFDDLLTYVHAKGYKVKLDYNLAILTLTISLMRYGKVACERKTDISILSNEEALIRVVKDMMDEVESVKE